MNKCFITKYPQSVDNDNLPALGSFRIKLLKSNRTGKALAADRYLSVVSSSNKDINYRIIGNGHFTDVTLTQDLGKIAKGSSYVSNEDVVVEINDNYLSEVWFEYSKDNSNICIQFDIEKFKYRNELYSIYLSSSTITGDISSLKDSKQLYSLNLGGTQVNGDIASLSGLTTLTSLNLAGTQVNGDIASLSGLTALTSLNLGGTQVNGDIADIIDKLIKLKSITIPTTIAITDEQKTTLTDRGCTITITQY